MDYLYSRIEENADMLEDPELVELAKDFAKLCHDAEWYHSSDTCRGTYQKTVDWFKEKWFKGNRDKRFIEYANKMRADLLRIVGVYDRCEDCRYSDGSPCPDYYACKKHTTCLYHKNDCCDQYEPK